MITQISFSSVEYANKKKQTCPDQFLASPEQVTIARAFVLSLALTSQLNQPRVRPPISLADGLTCKLTGKLTGKLIGLLEYTKARVRARVGHPFHVVKNLFKHKQARYLCSARDTAPLFTWFGFANLILAQWHLNRRHTRIAS